MFIKDSKWSTVAPQLLPDPLPDYDAVGETLARARTVADYCARNAGAVDCEGAFPVAEFEQLKAAGLLAVSLPRARGGPGLGTAPGTVLTLLQILEQLGWGNLAVGRVYEGHINAVQLVQLFGTGEQQLVCTADVSRGKLFGVWNTESEDGVRLVPGSAGRYYLEGAKTFASGAGQVERALIGAALPDGGGWQLCLVPMDSVTTRIDPSWWQPLGMRASASFKVDFTGVELDASALIGQPGDYYRQPWLTTGVIRFAAVQLGGAAALLDAAREHLHKCQYTNDPYQKARMGEAAIAIESGRLWLTGGARLMEELLVSTDDATAAKTVTYANMLRTAVESACQQVMQLVERSCGARTLVRPHPVERIVRDLTIYLRQPACDAALASVGSYVLEQTNPIQCLWSGDERQ